MRSGKARSCGRPPRRARRRQRRAARCVYFQALGSFIHADTAGVNRLRFSGRVAGFALKPGSYSLSATARSPGGASATRRVAFTIKR